MRRVILETACGCQKVTDIPDSRPYVDVALKHEDPAGVELDLMSTVTYTRRTFEFCGEVIRGETFGDVYIYREVLR
jgi:hypothetical protein